MLAPCTSRNFICPSYVEAYGNSRPETLSSLQLGGAAVLAIRLIDIVQVALLGLGTTSSVVMGAALGLYVPFPKKVLAGILAFAAGSLIAALAIELGFEGAHDLIRHGASVRGAWVSIAGGFAVGAIIYYVTSLFLDQKGAA